MQFAFFGSLIANMATILINFQQKFALVRSFQHFAITFPNQKAEVGSTSQKLRRKRTCNYSEIIAPQAFPQVQKIIAPQAQPQARVQV